MSRHPAHEMPFDKLWAGLQDALVAGDVMRQISEDGLHLYCYSKQCVFEKHWTPITLAARGLIINPKERRIVATPFPKFFNVGELEGVLPDMPFETFEKLDGSLIIAFCRNQRWHTATKGSFSSDQAKWALERFKVLPFLPDPDWTYLFEAIYPENRIVVHYPYTGLVLLGAYAWDGEEINPDALFAEVGDVRKAKVHSYAAVSELLAKAKELPASEEGFVLRFANGYRVKIKGDEYCRIHRLVSRVTPLAMWEAMMAGDDMQALKAQLPEEFWTDFDGIVSATQQRIDALEAEVMAAARDVAALSDKEVGLRLSSMSETARKFIFPYRKMGSLLAGKARAALFRTIRPTGNVLPGYVPSYAINRVLSEEG